jgi:hypothetical protein
LKTLQEDYDIIYTNVENVNKSLKNVLNRQDAVTAEVTSMCEQFDSISLVQPIIDKFNTISKTDISNASDFTIRENFPLLLSGFDILHKELLRVSAELIMLKKSVSLGDSDDEDYVD